MLKNSSLPIRKHRVHKNTIKVAFPLFLICLLLSIILAFFHTEIIRFAQKRIDQTLIEFSLKPEKKEPVQRQTLQQEKEALTAAAVADFRPQELIAFNRFLRTHEIPSEKRSFAGLLYVYPFGFTIPGENNVKYNTSLHDFSVIVPKTWTVFPMQPNFVAFLSPDTVLTDEGRLQEPNEAFDVFFYKDCEGMSKDELIADTIKNLRTAPAIRMSGPEEVALTPTLMAIKYRYRVPKDSYIEPVYWRQDIYLEDYFVTVGKETYLINYTYVPSMQRKYRTVAQDIINSFTTEGKSCGDDYQGLSQDQINTFYLGEGSRYQQAKLLLAPITNK